MEPFFWVVGAIVTVNILIWPLLTYVIDGVRYLAAWLGVHHGR